ncbi:MAG: flagellar hook-associated protein 1 [Frankiaceae bacterium]|nr:flagellar hook-associated protein 1 [Frankiaceae bacterium]
MFSTLNIGASALFATQRAVETASHNIANATVDGYSRQRVEMTSATPSPGTLGARSDGMRGNGVVVTDVTRLHDQLADVAVRSELTADGYAEARSTTLDRAQSVLGPVWDGAPAKLDALFASFNNLANNPTDPAARDAVLSAGQEVSRSLNDASQQLSDITSASASKVSGDVDRLNQLTAQVANLNQGVIDARASGQAPNDLLDSRDRAIDELHKLAGVTIHENALGVIDVYAGTKSLVRDNESFALQAGQTPGTGVPTVAFADGSSASVGGEIGGYIAVTTIDLPAVRASLDAVARGLATAVNAQHSVGTGLDGSTGNAFFSGTDAATLAVSPSLVPAKIAASAGGAANDGNNALALFRVSTNTTAVTLPGGAPTSIGDALRALGGRLGSLASGAAAVAKTTSTAVDSATKTRSSQNGVSIDEEMVDLVKYQHAYSAAAKVVSTADQMLDTLINRLGV